MESLEHKICLDTDFLVNFLRNKKEEAEFIEKYEEQVIFSVTTITIFELYYGAYKSGFLRNVLKVEELEARLRVLSGSTEAMKKAGEILAILEKNGEVIEFRDLLIGCTAMMEGFSIKTNNKKHFQRIPNLVIE